MYLEHGMHSFSHSTAQVRDSAEKLDFGTALVRILWDNILSGRPIKWLDEGTKGSLTWQQSVGT